MIYSGIQKSKSYNFSDICKPQNRDVDVFSEENVKGLGHVNAICFFSE